MFGRFALTVQAVLMMIGFAATIYSQAIPPDPTTIAPVIHPPNPQTNIVLSLADFLVDNNGHRRSPYQALKLAIEACRQQNAARLIIPTGVYAFNDPQILQDGAHIGLYSLSDLTIDGQGSEFIFHFPIAGFNFDGCHRLLIRNLTIDTDLLLASLGVVQKAGGSTNIRILDVYPINANTPFVAISPYDIQNLKWKGAPGEIFSPRNVTMIGPHLFTSPDFNSLADGEEVVVRHYTYEGNAFSIPTYLTSDVSFENITIYEAPGMGFYIAGQRGFRLSNCRIMQKPGTQRPVSTAADGSHFTNTAGDILVEDCDFSGQGDDSLNIASLWVPVTQRINSRTVILTRQYNEWIIQQGSEIKFVRRNNLAEICRRHVTQVTYDQSSGRFTTTVDQDLPTNLMVGDLAINLTQNNSRFLIRRNFFHDHRARGMLIQSWNGIIENNRVSHPTWQGIDLFTDGYLFLEGPGPQNVIVRNNTFKGCSYGNYGSAGDTMGAVNITADVPGGISDQRIDHNILLDGNVISDTPGLAMFVSCAAGLTISNNVILNSNTLGLFPPWYGSAIGVTPHGSIMITKASSVLLTNNLQVNRYQQPEKSIYFDPQTTAGIHIQNNSEASPTTGGKLAISGDYLSGSPITLMAIANPGYSFANWSENGTILSTSSSYTFPLNANRALLASFVTIATNAASDVTSSSATLNGTVNPNGLTTTVHFEYGTTTNYGHATPNGNYTGNTTQNVSANITGLTPSTTYHFRIVGTSSGGTRYGSDRTFTTLSPTGVPVAATSAATNVASFSATLRGSVYPHGLATTVYFEYGTTTSYGLTTAPQSHSGNTYQKISATVGALSANTVYHFRIVATNAAGTRVGADRPFTTLTATGPPVVITNAATNVTSSSARLNGSLDPHGLATTVYFEYGTTTGYGHTTPMQSQTGNTYRNIFGNSSGLATNSIYHFRIVATNSAGIRYSSDRTFRTP